MKKYLLIALILLSAVACTRSVSPSGLPYATEDPLESIFSTIATQTALAGGNKAPDQQGEVTETLGLGISTSTFAATSTTVATATTTPAPTQQYSVPGNYTLHQGEWPYCLARRFDIDPDALLAANGLTPQSAANLSIGTKLVIPTNAGPFGGQRALRAHPTTYVATGSDTLYSIACAFGDMWPEHIADANGMGVDDPPTGGQQLHIP
jgi:LysM repeat protein